VGAAFREKFAPNEVEMNIPEDLPKKPRGNKMAFEKYVLKSEPPHHTEG